MYSKILLIIFLLQYTAPYCLAQFDDADSEPYQSEDNTQTTSEGPETTTTSDGNDDDILDDDNPGDDEFPEGFKVIDGIVMDVTNVLIQEVTKNATLYRMYDNSSSKNGEMEEVVFQRPKHEGGWHFILFEDPDEVTGFGHLILLQKLLGFTINNTDNFRLYEAFHVDLRDEFAESKDDEKEFKRLLEDFQSKENERKRNMSEMFSNDSSEYEEEEEDTALEGPDNEFQNPLEQETGSGLSSVPLNNFQNNNRKYQATDIVEERNPRMPPSTRLRAQNAPKYKSVGHFTVLRNLTERAPEDEESPEINDMPTLDSFFFTTAMRHNTSDPIKGVDQNAFNKSSSKISISKSLLEDFSDESTVKEVVESITGKYPKKPLNHFSRVDMAHKVNKSSSKIAMTKSLLEDFSDETTVKGVVESITEKYRKKPHYSRAEWAQTANQMGPGKPGGFSIDDFQDKKRNYGRSLEPALSGEYVSTMPSQFRSHKLPLYKAMNRRK